VDWVEESMPATRVSVTGSFFHLTPACDLGAVSCAGRRHSVSPTAYDPAPRMTRRPRLPGPAYDRPTRV